MSLVLIVDDDQHVREVMVRWIEGAGHEVLEAESADAALRVMEKRPAAVVYSDVQMPGRDGLWLTAELRRRYPHTAVVLATVLSTITPSITLRHGVLAYLVKPLSRGPVIEALTAALAWHTETITTGPRPEDTPDRLEEWLNSLK